MGDTVCTADYLEQLPDGSAFIAIGSVRVPD
jgi:hypothetical protein